VRHNFSLGATTQLWNKMDKSNQKNEHAQKRLLKSLKAFLLFYGQVGSAD